MAWKNTLFSKYCNLDEIVFDATTAGVVFLLYYFVLPDGGTILANVENWALFVMVVSIEFFVMVYILGVMRSYEDKMYGITRTLLRSVVFIVINGLFLSMVVIIGAFQIVPESLKGGDYEMVVFMALSAPFFLALLTAKGQKNSIDVGYLFYIPGIILLVTFPMSLFVINGDTIWVLGVLLFLAMIALLISPGFQRKLFRGKKGKNKKMWSFLRRAGKYLIVPIIIAISLSLWHEISLMSLVQAHLKNNSSVSAGFLLFTLLISGIIPIRVLSALAPPYRVINSIISVAVLLFYFWNIVRHVRHLSAIH